MKRKPKRTKTEVEKFIEDKASHLFYEQARLALYISEALGGVHIPLGTTIARLANMATKQGKRWEIKLVKWNGKP